MPPLGALVGFEHPERLFLLALLPLLALLAWGSRAAIGGRARTASLILRMLVAALLIGALAVPRHEGRSDRRMVVLATDVSASAGGAKHPAAETFIEAVRAARGRHRVAVLPFAGQVGSLRDDLGGDAESLETSASDPGEALRFAAALIPGDYVPQVVLLTDGLENRGELSRAAYGVNLPVSVVPLPSFPLPEVCVAAVDAPHSTSRGVDIPVEVEVRSNHADRGTLALFADGERLDERELAVAQGAQRVSFRVPWSDRPERVLEARLAVTSDSLEANNVRRAAVAVRGGYRVLLVADEPASCLPLTTALVKEGCAVTAASVQAWDAGTLAAGEFDVCLLVGVDPRQVAAVTPALEHFVSEQGGGLIVIGGPATFTRQAGEGAALERMLPVAAAASQVEPPADVLAMVLVIDKSTSMEEEDRMALAKEAAKQAIDVLSPGDMVGIIAFSTGVEWVAELAPRGAADRLKAQLDLLEPAGSTEMYPALERALLALKQTAADRKHMILLTDGIPSPGDYLELAGRLAAAGVSLSTVSIGAGAERRLLERMAALADGRHAHCDDPTDVPGIVVRETQRVAAGEQRRTFRPFALRALPGLSVSGAPLLEETAATDLKEGAEPLLFGQGGSPLLCWWRFGAGIAVAFTSDIRQGGEQAWLSWEDSGRFWQRLIRHAARPPAADPLAVEITARGDWAELQLSALDAGGLADSGLEPQVRVLSPQGRETAGAADLVAPGRYTMRFPVSELGRYDVEIEAARTGRAPLVLQRAWYRDYPEELLWQPADEALLRSVAAATGGAFAPQAASVFAEDGRTVQRVTRFGRPLLLAALLLFLADLALRRLALLTAR